MADTEDMRNVGTVKSTNPKDRFGVNKVSLSLVPCTVLMELALAMTEGSIKYGPYNWREGGARASIYYDAAMRHLMAWWEGENIDPDSGVSHLIKAMSSLIVLRDAMLMGKLEDDRPDSPPPEDWLKRINEQSVEMKRKLEAIRNPLPKFED